ncbi:MAG TPA: hypothetical protein VGK88_06275 [bacterium]
MFKHVRQFGLAVLVTAALSVTLFAGLARAAQLFSISYPDVLRDTGFTVTSISYPDVLRDAGLTVASISYPEILREAGLTANVAGIVWPQALRNKN